MMCWHDQKSIEGEKPITHDVRVGYLGWSNVRPGLEFYRADGKNSRWQPRQNPHYNVQETGALLQDDIEQVKTPTGRLGEGCACVVITLDTRDINKAAALAVALAQAMQQA